MVFHQVALMLFRLVIVIGVAVRLNGKYGLLAHSVDNEKIQMCVAVGSLLQFFWRHHGSVFHNLTQRNMAQHFQVIICGIGCQYFTNQGIGQVL